MCFLLFIFFLKFQVPLCVIVAWVLGMNMDLNFNILETASLALSILASSSILQVHPSRRDSRLCFIVFYL